MRTCLIIIVHPYSATVRTCAYHCTTPLCHAEGVAVWLVRALICITIIIQEKLGQPSIYRALPMSIFKSFETRSN